MLSYYRGALASLSWLTGITAAAITAVLTEKAKRESTALTIINGIRKKVIAKDIVKSIRRSIRTEKDIIQDITKSIPTDIFS